MQREDSGHGDNFVDFRFYSNETEYVDFNQTHCHPQPLREKFFNIVSLAFVRSCGIQKGRVYCVKRVFVADK